jgi:hypothetical protein
MEFRQSLAPAHPSSLVCTRLLNAASTSSMRIKLRSGAFDSRWLSLSSVKPRSERFSRHISYDSAPASAWMNDDLPDPGGPCSRYPLRYGIPITIKPTLSPPLSKKKAKGVGRTSVRIPLTPREERAHVLGNALCDAARKNDAV